MLRSPSPRPSPPGRGGNLVTLSGHSEVVDSIQRGIGLNRIQGSLVVISMLLGNLLILNLMLVCGCVSARKVPATAIDIKPLTPGECIVVTLIQDATDDQDMPQVLDSSGDVSLFYVGKIHLAGLTPNEAQKQIHDAYVPMCFSWLNVSVRR